MPETEPGFYPDHGGPSELTETVVRRSDGDDGLARRTPPGWLWLTALLAVGGAYFAAVSSHDFILHLDGQVHAVTCSVAPGADPVLGASGCKAAMLSPYSSFFRQSYWGGIPVSLLALGVFAFIAAFAAYLALRRDTAKRHTGFLWLATLLPVITSAVYYYLAKTEVGEVCEVCAGIYLASGLTFLVAGVAHWRAVRGGPGGLPWGSYALWFGEGVAFVALMVLVYVAAAPTERHTLTGCGRLVDPTAEPGLLISLPRAPEADTPALAVIDPLCPACRVFEQRLALTGLGGRLATDVLLFPLDKPCNWMVKDSLHPGACAVTEAIHCAPEDAPAMLDYAFAHQEELLALGKEDDAKLRAELERVFPKVKGCLGSARVKAIVNKSLRWAVPNALNVQTPQLFIDGTRLCDEDTDLGLDYTLSQFLNAPKAEVTP